MRATEDQQALINKVLNVFATELDDLYGRRGDEAAESSLGEGRAARRCDVGRAALAEKRGAP